MLARYSSAVVKDASVHHQRWLSDEPPQTVWHLHDVIQFLRHSETANHTITVSMQQFVGCVEVRKEPGLEHRLSKRSLFFPYATISVTCVDLRVRHYECLAGETVCKRVPLFSYIMASDPFLWRPAFQPAWVQPHGAAGVAIHSLLLTSRQHELKV